MAVTYLTLNRVRDENRLLGRVMDASMPLLDGKSPPVPPYPWPADRMSRWACAA